MSDCADFVSFMLRALRGGKQGGGGQFAPEVSVPPPLATPAFTPVWAPPPKITTTGQVGYSEAGPPEEWDMALGTVRGYRCWTLRIPPYTPAHKGRLVHDLNNNYPALVGAFGYRWDKSEIEARCIRYKYVFNLGGAHEPPEYQEKCGCGIWAYWKPQANFGFIPPSPISYLEIPVFGVVQGSGRVILGEKGFRAQHAKIEALALGSNAREVLGWWDGPSRALWERIPASEVEITSRVVDIEDWLAVKFDGVRVLTDQSSVETLFPPDPVYGSR